ncbi:hypothetical protein ACP4OV_005354 [Aristida adscensionis]
MGCSCSHDGTRATCTCASARLPMLRSRRLGAATPSRRPHPLVAGSCGAEAIARNASCLPQQDRRKLESMAESMVLPVVTRVASKAADGLVQSIARMWGVDADCNKIEQWMLAVQCKLADAEVKSETNPVVRRWMKELKAAAYQADDVLDDFQYEALRREAQDSKSTAHKVLRYFTLHSPLLFRLTVSRNLNKVLKKINKLVLEMHVLDLAECMVSMEEPQAMYSQMHAALDESVEIFGRDGDKDVVVKLLLEQQYKKNVEVLPILGMGGLGKTTLAKMVLNDRRVRKHFELRMWHCVSENFEATAVLRSIIELATFEPCGLPDTPELLQGRLQGVIGRKRFLLVLDDVWNEEQYKWEEILKPLLCSCTGGSGSMIVVTTRSQRVASIMGTLPPHELVSLGEDDSWALFSRKAFSKGVQEQIELVTIGRSIVSKCKGLPLALNAMGALMSSKRTVQDWVAIAESDISDTNRGKDEVLSVLKLSYRHLSSEMKQCFAFCAVFPKDYEMEKDKLTQLWMANGFIHEEGPMNLAQKGEFVFSELAWRSFLQDVKAKRIFLSSSVRDTIGCKLHDLMHDLAKDVTDECASAEDLVQGKALIKDVYHLQVPWLELKGNSASLEDTSSLRTLLTQSEHRELQELKLMSLRALCCEDHSIIHRQLINTAHLRYLDLSWSKIVSLPSSVCMLYNLQTLWLNGCSRLQNLPEGMNTMMKLSHFYLLECDTLERMPPKLGLLHNLRTLTTFIVDTGDGFGIEELKELRQLSNKLELFNLRKVRTGSKVNLFEKQNLSEIELYWGRDRDYDPLYDEVCNNEDEILESLVPHDELKVLKVHGYGGLAISQWMRDPKMFECLKELVITECPRCKDIPIVWLSSSLEKLYLSYMISLTTLCNSIDMPVPGYNSPLPIFPKLKRMELRYLPELERWAENSTGEPITLMFPLLEELTINHCYKLGSVPECPVLTHLSCRGHSARDLVPISMPLGSLPSLTYLNIGLLADVKPLEPQSQSQSQSQRQLDTLHSLEILGDNGFISIFNLSKSQLGFWNCFAFVEQLNIFACHKIVCWPVEELQCLPRLRSLHIWLCNKLEGRGSSSEEMLLPQLEWLLIQSCDSLLEIPKLPASLEEMEIRNSRSLVVLPSNLGNLNRLRKLSVEDCSALKALPDGMDRLTSLRWLIIEECPGIENFPQGLLQQLPALKFLKVVGCTALQKRCRQGGQYFNLVSSIPEKDIPAPESHIKKFVNKLLPSC